MVLQQGAGPSGQSALPQSPGLDLYTELLQEIPVIVLHPFLDQTTRIVELKNVVQFPDQRSAGRGKGSPGRRVHVLAGKGSLDPGLSGHQIPLGQKNASPDGSVVEGSPEVGEQRS